MNSQSTTPLPSNQQLSGTAAAPGLTSGPLVVKKELVLSLPDPYPCRDPDQAWDKISTFIEQVVQDLKVMEKKVAQDVGPEEAAIFAAHQTIVQDPALKEQVTKLLKQGTNPEAAWHQAVENFAAMLEALPDPTLQARAADIRDVGNQVLAKLLGQDRQEIQLQRPAVIAAQDLTPSETAQLDKDLVLAFCTVEGGSTSHSAILAKALGIPAVVGMGSALLDIPEGTMVLVNGTEGNLTVNPTEEMLAEFTVLSNRADQQFQTDLARAHQPAVTRDGHQVEIAANIGNLADARQAVEMGAEAVGLFRTEFLYLERTSLPDISEQVASYREIIQALEGRPLVVRTLDIGGDKQVSYLGLEQEPNPFLGWRAVRMISERPEIIKDQMFSLLMAGEGSDLRIMIPLVSRVEEVVQTRKILDQALQQVKSEKENFQIDLQFGIMVEVPSAALLVPQIAPLVDFFSIGTNDLTQYTLAVDRMNTRVASLASPFHPAVLQLIQQTVTQAHRAGKWVGMCGEFAGNPLAAPFLLGVGLDEYSMAPRSIPAIKREIRGYQHQACRQLVPEVLQLSSDEEVKIRLKTFREDNWAPVKV